MNRSVVLIDAPSNLGLRPPVPGSVPGCAKLAGALRDQGLPARLGAREGGVVTPPRYDRGAWREGGGVFHAAAIGAYSVRLADRLQPLVAARVLVTALARSPRCAGLHLTIYDPDLDPEGTGAVLLADLLTDCTGFAQP